MNDFIKMLWNKYWHKIITYWGIGILSWILVAALEDTRVEPIAIYIPILALFVILFDIGRSMQDRNIKKKYFIYLAVFGGEIIIAVLFSVILGMGIQDSWLGFVSINMGILTIFVALFDIVRSMKNNIKDIDIGIKVGYLLFVIVIFGIFMLGIGVAAMLTTLLG